MFTRWVVKSIDDAGHERRTHVTCRLPNTLDGDTLQALLTQQVFHEKVDRFKLYNLDHEGYPGYNVIEASVGTEDYRLIQSEVIS